MGLEAGGKPLSYGIGCGGIQNCRCQSFLVRRHRCHAHLYRARHPCMLTVFEILGTCDRVFRQCNSLYQTPRVHILRRPPHKILNRNANTLSTPPPLAEAASETANSSTVATGSRESLKTPPNQNTPMIVANGKHSPACPHASVLLCIHLDADSIEPLEAQGAHQGRPS